MENLVLSYPTIDDSVSISATPFLSRYYNSINHEHAAQPSIRVAINQIISSNENQSCELIIKNYLKIEECQIRLEYRFHGERHKLDIFVKCYFDHPDVIEMTAYIYLLCNTIPLRESRNKFREKKVQTRQIVRKLQRQQNDNVFRNNGNVILLKIAGTSSENHEFPFNRTNLLTTDEYYVQKLLAITQQYYSPEHCRIYLWLTIDDIDGQDVFIGDALSGVIKDKKRFPPLTLMNTYPKEEVCIIRAGRRIFLSTGEQKEATHSGNTNAQLKVEFSFIKRNNGYVVGTSKQFTITEIEENVEKKVCVDAKLEDNKTNFYNLTAIWNEQSTFPLYSPASPLLITVNKSNDLLFDMMSLKNPQ
ncbi:unnamed protein product, partial [Didymodactylos carnosus]